MRVRELYGCEATFIVMVKMIFMHEMVCKLIARSGEDMNFSAYSCFVSEYPFGTIRERSNATGTANCKFCESAEA
jgi:hypothetical protein